MLDLALGIASSCAPAGGPAGAAGAGPARVDRSLEALRAEVRREGDWSWIVVFREFWAF